MTKRRSTKAQSLVPASGVRTVEVNTFKKRHPNEVIVMNSRPSQSQGSSVLVQPVRQQGGAKQTMSKGNSQNVNLKAAMPKVMKSLSEANPVALSIALPAVHPPVRPPGPWTCQATSTAQLHSVENVDFTAMSASQSLFEDGQFVAGVSKDPVHASFVTARNIGINSYVALMELVPPGTSYTVVYGGGDVPSSMQQPLIHSQPGTIDINPSTWVPEATSAAKVFGDNIYPFNIGGRQALFINSTAARPTTLMALHSSGVMSWSSQTYFTAFQWQSNNWVAIKSAGFTGGDNSPIASMSLGDVTGYISLQLCHDLSNSVDWSTLKLNFLVDQQADTLVFRPLPHLSEHYSTLNNILVTGSAVMLSPNANMMVETGQLAGTQTDPLEPFFLDAMDFDTIAERPDSAVMTYKKGIYGFHKPNTSSELEPYIPFRDEMAGTTRLLSKLEDAHGWTIVCGKVPIVSGVAESGSMYLTCTYGIVFRTQSQWFQPLHPHYSYEIYIELMKAIRDVPQWHENPMHVKDVVNFFKKYGRKAVKLAPSLLMALAKFAPGKYKPAILGVEAIAELVSSSIG